MLYPMYIAVCNILLNKHLAGGIEIAKKQQIFAVRIKSDKVKRDFSKFVQAKKEVDYTTGGKELENAIYEYMAKEGFDLETGKFIDFDDDEEEELMYNPKHTHIDPKHVKHIDIAEKRKSKIQETGEEPVNIENVEEEAISALNVNTEQTMFLKVKGPSNEQLYTYAFCKVFKNMSEVHYEQIEQLSIPFFKSKDNRAVKNKPNILIGNQCIIKTNKNNYKTLPSGMQQYITENSYLEEILKERVNMDFLEALKP
ncbi:MULTISPECIES: hypothetical protein [Methanobacterium]|uniref:Uncharacterized protein n=1 Tax=Methanobacterium bryantii TaxID=2161 RepID=A0A2A2H763_METBR|nr:MULTISPECIES: hypothetical protein [Methanobacterium]OEC84934.1 hypothetical protein A9507_00975 [Methanobacterium sp. A39]PAV05083.1 hypothetical protein ASJ80_12395 [Methanobacterium bryantii]